MLMFTKAGKDEGKLENSKQRSTQRLSSNHKRPQQNNNTKKKNKN